MAEPTSILTFYDLILRTAELAGVAYFGSDGQQRAMIPIDDVNTFDKCKRVVNDGIRMFIAGAPERGWLWKNRIQSVTFGSVEVTGECDSAGDSTSLIDSDLEAAYDTDDDLVGYYVYNLTQGFYALITDYTASGGDITVAAWLTYDDVASSFTPADEDEYAITDVKVVAGDKARYWLDQDFGRVAGEITWAADSARGHGLTWTHEAEIRARREVTVSSGYPQLAAVRRYRNQRRWELIVDPSPVATDTIEFPYELGFDELRMEGGIGNAGDATSITDDDLADLYSASYFVGWKITLIDGTGKFSYATVTEYTTAGKFTVADWLSRDGTAGGKDPGATTAYYVEPAYNKHPAGLLFDDAILAACLAQVEMQYEDVQGGYVQKFYDKDLPDAWNADKRTAPRKLGKMTRGGTRAFRRIAGDIYHYDIDGNITEA